MENYFSSLTITLVILEISNKQLIESFATIPTPTNHEDVCYTPTIQQYQPSKKPEKISPESFDDEGRL